MSINLSQPGSTSYSLIGRLRNLDREGWRRFSLLYGPLVYSWCRRSGLQDMDAADVVQEVFRSVLTSIQRFESERGFRFRGWLWCITRNKVRDHFRRVGKIELGQGGSSAQEYVAAIPEELPSSLSGDDLHQDLVRRALAILETDFEPHTWQAFWRSAIEGDPVHEISNDLGMTPKAIRQAKYRVLRRLRAELGELD